MNLTPYTVRLDLKCGSGTKACGGACIPRAHDCNKGAAKALKKASAVTALVGGVGQLATAGAAVGALTKGNFKQANRFVQASAGFQAVTAVGVRGVGLKKEANQMLGNAAGVASTASLFAGDYGRAARAARGAGRGAAARASTLKGRVTQFRARRRLERSFKKDSPYAAGFSIDTAELAI